MTSAASLDNQARDRANGCANSGTAAKPPAPPPWAYMPDERYWSDEGEPDSAE